jgi:hypothetical protein
MKNIDEILFRLYEGEMNIAVKVSFHCRHVQPHKGESTRIISKIFSIANSAEGRKEINEQDFSSSN